VTGQKRKRSPSLDAGAPPPQLAPSLRPTAAMASGGSLALANARPPPPPLTAAGRLELMKKSSAASKRVIVELARAANDLFANKPRTVSGISRDVPPAWERFVLGRFQWNKEVLSHVWAALASGRRDAATRARVAKLAGELEREYKSLDVLKERVKTAVRGPLEVAPPLGGSGAAGAAAGGGGGGAGGAEPDVNAARSQVISLLNMLQGPLDRAIQRATALPMGTAGVSNQ
jgi:hypothetical protein